MIDRSLVLLALLLLTPSAAAQLGPSKKPVPLPTPSGQGKINALEVEAPIRIAKTSSGTFLITDHQQKLVIEALPDGFKKLHSIALEGRPIAVASLGNRVFVSHDDTDHVEIYLRNGRFIGRLGGSQTTFAKANDIAVDPTLGLVVVVDSLDNVVKLFDLSKGGAGTLIRTIPDPGPDPNALAHPTAVAVDPGKGEILVSDFGATEISIKPRVQIFDYQGQLLSSISGKQGMMGYRFYRPQGITINDFGRIYLTDSYLGKIIVLDRVSGSTITTFGSYGKKAGELLLPLDVAIGGRSRDVFVTCYGSGRIEVFAKGGAVQ